MTGINSTTRWIGWGAMALVMWLCVVGCEPQKTNEPNDQQLPTIGDLKPANIRRVPNSSAPQVSTGQDGATGDPSDPQNGIPTPLPLAIDPNRRLVIQRYVFERHDAKLAFALALLNKPTIPAETLALWNANGMDWGCVDLDELPLLESNLPKPVTSDRLVMTPGISYMPVPMSGRLNGVHRVKYFESAEKSKTLKLIGGQYQVLARMMPPLAESSRERVELIPHHFAPEPSIVPRTPDEKMMDGKVFNELSITEPIPKNMVWILWSTGEMQPEAPEADTEPKAGQGDQTEGKTEEENKADERPAPTATRVRTARNVSDIGIPLGEALLTGKRYNKPIQLVIMITVR